MNFIIELFFLLGSFSAGYSVARAGFPLIQEEKWQKKLIAGYLCGLIIFGVPIAIEIIFGLNVTAFLIASIGIYVVLLGALFAKRFLLKENDPIIQKKEKQKAVLPKKIIFEHGLMIGSRQKVIKPEEVKKQVFKEKTSTIIRELEKKTKEMNKKNEEKEKNEALDRLRVYAQEIKEKKPEKKKTELEEAEEMNEIEEELLNKIGSEGK